MSITRRTIFLHPVAQVSALIFALLMPLGMNAQEAPKRELTDKVSEALPGINKMITEEKNFHGAINLIDNLLSQVKPESFDTAYLSQMKAQAYIGIPDYVSCIQPLETAYQLSRRYGFFEKRGELELLWMLAQLYVQDASLEKNLDVQKQKFARALSTVREWLSLTPKPTFDAYYFAATILYTQATTAGKDPDKELLKQAEVECQNALTTALKPKETVYQLLVAIAQANNDSETASKYLEIMIEANPKSASYWTMLLGAYLTVADPLPEGSALRNESFARAVYTIERAQKNGFMTGFQDYQRLLACYFNSGQFEGAIDVLEGGLRTGKVENTYKNWELLAQSYLQINQTQKAIDTFKEVSKIPEFANDGNIDMQIGNLYYNMEQYRVALDAMKTAKAKGVTPAKLPSLLFFTAYLHFELKELDEALDSVQKSLELDPNNRQAKDVQVAIKDAIEDRNRNLKKDQPPATGAAKQTQPQAAPAK